MDHLAGEFLQKTLDSLQSHIAILAEDGTILAVNAPWRRFGRQNGLIPGTFGPGANYLDVCDVAQGPCSREGRPMADGIRRVIAGERREFSLEYPCHSPWEQRWFQVRVTRFEIGGLVRAVVAHDNITARKLAELEVQQANEQLQRQASTDGLTQVSNRRMFDEALQSEWSRHRTQKRSLAVLLIDVDFFKKYNDTCGHLAGDDCLQAVARAIAETVELSEGCVARYGGEEFAAILPQADAGQAATIAENIRSAISALGLPHPDSPISRHVTVSIGCAAQVPRAEEQSSELVNRADAALYAAKQSGRHCVRVFSSDTDTLTGIPNADLAASCENT